jgi:hypothetical protein
MESVADAYDYALAKSFVATLKRELLHRHSWPSRKRPVRVRISVHRVLHNLRRRHSTLV